MVGDEMMDVQSLVLFFYPENTKNRNRTKLWPAEPCPLVWFTDWLSTVVLRSAGWRERAMKDSQLAAVRAYLMLVLE
jgi:hypothetical protein